MIGVDVQDDLVILHLTNRRTDVLLTCAAAEELTRQLRAKAAIAEHGKLTLVKGERWEIKTQSYDGFVAIRFFPPTVGAITRVPLPPRIARALADDIEFKFSQAKHMIRFTFANQR